MLAPALAGTKEELIAKVLHDKNLLESLASSPKPADEKSGEGQ